MSMSIILYSIGNLEWGISLVIFLLLCISDLGIVLCLYWNLKYWQFS